MNAEAIIRSAIPGADDDLVEHVLWGRTPFPCGAINARSLFKAASGFRRACTNKRQLCDFCHNMVTTHRWTCDPCQTALSRTASA